MELLKNKTVKVLFLVFPIILCSPLTNQSIKLTSEGDLNANVSVTLQQTELITTTAKPSVTFKKDVPQMTTVCFT